MSNDEYWSDDACDDAAYEGGFKVYGKGTSSYKTAEEPESVSLHYHEDEMIVVIGNHIGRYDDDGVWENSYNAYQQELEELGDAGFSVTPTGKINFVRETSVEGFQK